MEKHSGIGAKELLGKDLFDVFTYLPRDWLLLKFQSVLLIGNFSFVSWRQRPYLFKFHPDKPLLGEDHSLMYQDCAIFSVENPANKEPCICIAIKDVTNIAASHKKIKEMDDITKTLMQISNYDSLTSIYNRRYIEQQIDAEFKKAARYGGPFSLIMFDLDHFKKVNDERGHLAGDEVLKQVAAAVKKQLRSADVLGRYGGEEFIILLPHSNEFAACQLSQRLRQTIENLGIEYQGQKICVTASLGLVEYRPDMQDHMQMIHETDQAMYRAKNAGRNTCYKYMLTGCRPAEAAPQVPGRNRRKADG
jgi:diguanylate cyclase (GGDEF)-like protein